MKLAVNNTVELPHTVQYKGVSYDFAPACDVPDDFGNALVANQGKVFFVPEGEVTVDGYTFKDAFKNKSIGEIVGKLSDEDKVKVFQFAKALATGGVPPVEGDPLNKEPKLRRMRS